MDEYSGSITTTGRSNAIRLDKVLFRQHPEFHQKAKVRAHIIGPGQLLVSVIDDLQITHEETEDPVIGAFLSFLEQDMLQRPEGITPLEEDFLQRVAHLTQGVEVSDDEILPNDVSF
jgi:antitoxin PrlF